MLTDGAAASAATPSLNAKTVTTISNYSTLNLTKGKSTTLSGKITDSKGHPLPGQTFTVQWRIGKGSWHNVKRVKVGKDGRGSLSVRPSSSATWRLVHPANTVYGASGSWEKRVNVVTPVPKNKRIVNSAAAQRGKPYANGGAGPNSFDCSGLAQFVHRAAGIKLPRTTGQQSHAVRHVSNASKTPGDMIFFGSASNPYHVGIYAGNGKIWAAPDVGDVVKLQNIWTSDYFVGRAW